MALGSTGGVTRFRAVTRFGDIPRGEVETKAEGGSSCAVAFLVDPIVSESPSFLLDGVLVVARAPSTMTTETTGGGFALLTVVWSLLWH
ncbi:hypothetical protein [Rhodococcus sp. 14-2496-1d]|uniref:hypothetical protein n=1 Tax=Rhodococcus sp. 14-2496-1d TaxID=2023146 RepID=UPI001179B188|nr:hypothetical protein [Rhodococcus sp. 14-2496-1d]